MMDKRCINHNSIQVKELSDELGLKPIIVAAKIAVWQDKNNTYDFPSANDLVEGVNYSIKAVDILLSDKAKQVFAKGNKNNWNLDKILTELAIPKEQKQLIENSYNNLLFVGKDEKGNDLIIKPTVEELALDLMQYDFKVNINTTKERVSYEPTIVEDVLDPETGEILVAGYMTNNKGDNTSYYSNLTVPGGTNGSYIEANIETPLITPSIKGHSQFSTDTSIGWYRMDEKQQYQEKDIENLIEIMKKNSILEVNCN